VSESETWMSSSKPTMPWLSATGFLLFDVGDVYNNHDNGKSEHERRR
jgi:hypothetical protein